MPFIPSHIDKFRVFSLVPFIKPSRVYIHDQSNNWAKVKTKPIMQNTSKLNVNCSTEYVVKET